MNAKQDLAMKLTSGSALHADTLVTSEVQLEQRAKNLRSFQEKYDAMLYIVEFIASFHSGDTRNPRQAKKMHDLKSLVAQTRNGLGICKPDKAG